MLFAITKFELRDIRQAILAASRREEGYQTKLSDGLRVINAILDKSIEVVPASEPETDVVEASVIEIDGIVVSLTEEYEEEEVHHGC